MFYKLCCAAYVPPDHSGGHLRCAIHSIPRFSACFQKQTKLNKDVGGISLRWSWDYRLASLRQPYTVTLVLQPIIHFYTVLGLSQLDCRWVMRHYLQFPGITFSWWISLDIGWYCLVSIYIVGSHDRWEFPLVFKPHKHSPCAYLMAG